ncbi:NIPA-like protein 2 isoform X2 [Danio rerio]
MGLGELGNFSAYGFAPASLIAPLGCVSVIASAVISVLFLKETLRASDVLGGALALTGTYFLVTFAPHSSPHVTANMVERSLVSWTFLIYFMFEALLFAILMYLYKCRNVKHIIIMMILVALLASVTVISVKAVSGMITETLRGSHLQLTYPIFYIMFIIMITSCAFQIKFLNEAMKLFDATEIVPINYVFFTASAVVAGILFYEEFYGISLVHVLMFGVGCLLAFTGVFLIARARPRIKMDSVFISMEQMPGKSCTDKVQPQKDDSKYKTLASKLTCSSANTQDEP